MNDRSSVDNGQGRVIVSGASGLIGTALCSRLVTLGFGVDRLVRRKARPESGEIPWNPMRGDLETSVMEGARAVVHLGGANVAAGRWSPQRKELILNSRVDSTGLISATLSKLERPPDVLICASAVGYYGDRGDEWVTEESEQGSGFLVQVCQAWEQAADPAREAGIRVVTLRIGMVLSLAGGALARMVTPFRLGLGGRVGSGKQYLSWIALEDMVDVVLHGIQEPNLEGPVNAVAPNPVIQKEFARTLGSMLGRPAWMPLPAFMVRLLFGEMGQALLLEGVRVRPKSLEKGGYHFHYPTLKEALKGILKKG